MKSIRNLRVKGRTLDDTILAAGHHQQLGSSARSGVSGRPLSRSLVKSLADRVRFSSAVPGPSLYSTLGCFHSLGAVRGGRNCETLGSIGMPQSIPCYSSTPSHPSRVPGSAVICALQPPQSCEALTLSFAEPPQSSVPRPLRSRLSSRCFVSSPGLSLSVSPIPNRSLRPNSWFVIPFS